MELRGGRQGRGWTGGGLDAGYRDDGTDEIVPYSEIIGWRGRCECGWQGEYWTRVPDPAQMNPLLRRIYATDEDAAALPTDVEDAIHAEWRLHVEPDLRLADVREAAAAAARTAPSSTKPYGRFHLDMDTRLELTAPIPATGPG